MKFSFQLLSSPPRWLNLPSGNIKIQSDQVEPKVKLSFLLLLYETPLLIDMLTIYIDSVSERWTYCVSSAFH